MKKSIPGVVETKQKLLAPIYSYEVDIGKAKPFIIEANRVDQINDSLIFMIEYADYNVYVAGFTKWKHFRITQNKQEPLKKLLAKAKTRRK